MKPRSITITLIAIVIVLQLISLIAVNQSTQTRLHDQAKLLAVHELDAKAKSLVIQVQQFLTPITSQLSISRQLFADNVLNTEHSRGLERYFLSQLRSNLGMNSMYLGRFDGSFVAVTRFEKSLLADYDKPVLRAKVSVVTNDNERRIEWREYSLLGEELNHWTDEADVYDPRQREWYINAQKHDQPVWTNAYSSSDSRKLTIAASVNLRDKTNVDAGVLGVTVDLSQLSDLVSAIPVSKQGSAFILDADLNHIAASLPRSLQEGVAGLEEESRLLWSEESADQHARHFSPPTTERGNRLSAVDRDWFSDDDTQAIVQRRIRLFDGALHWRILLMTPVVELELMHESVMRESMRRTMGIILLPGLVALLMIIGLSSPLQRLHRRATIDYLTKALNREEFLNRFSKRLSKACQRKRNRIQWVAVALDLDGFKQINDQHGHDAGDAILKTVVCRLQQNVCRPGFVGRLGGDEFAFALKLQPGVDARTAVEHIRRTVVSEPIQSAHSQHQIGMTAGFALARKGDTISSLLERADRALVSGKVIAKNVTYCSVVNVQLNQPIPLNTQKKPGDLTVAKVSGMDF